MLLAALFGSVQRYLRYRSLLSGIEGLDDRLLYDIGLNRGELSAAAWAQCAITSSSVCPVPTWPMVALLLVSWTSSAM